MAQSDFSDLKSQLDSAHQVAILLPKNPSTDSVAASLALKLCLESTGKIVSIACPDPVTVEFHRLVGADTITNNFGSRNLVITFPDQTEMVDKVSYNVENNVLQLVITPKANTPGLDYRHLKFVSGGAQADLVILMGVGDLSNLGQIYIDAKDSLSQTKQYSISDSPYSQTVTRLINSLALPLSADAANNLFMGLRGATDNFQSQQVTADTFETAAFLMRKGAQHQQAASISDFPSGSIPSSTPATISTPTDSPAPITQPEPDWYEPKIFKGTTTA